MNAKFLFLGVILFGASVSVAQDARAILKRSYKKCQSIKNGHYEMTLPAGEATGNFLHVLLGVFLISS